jgi:hypothetical protein
VLQTYNTKSVLIWDGGLYPELAVTLSKSFGKVYYHSPWNQGGMPKENFKQIGKVPKVERTDRPFEVIDDVDLFIFPDLYFPDIQAHLEKLGKRVFGSKYGEELEIYRDMAKSHFKKIGLPISPYEVIEGLEKLREYLRKNKDQFVKISETRGDTESFHSESYPLIEGKLDEMAHELGKMGDLKKFIVEGSIKKDGEKVQEIGYDGWCIDGIFPNQSLWGVESKDKGYLGIIQESKDMPDPIVASNDMISETMLKYKYRNLYSTELIVKPKEWFFLESTCRFPEPPNGLQLHMIKNLPDVFWHGAEGKCLDPEFDEPCGAELILDSDFAQKNWQAVEIPKEITENVKLKKMTVIKNEYYIVPQIIQLPEIGSVVATGKTLKEAKEKCVEYAKMVKGFMIDSFPESLDEAEEQMNIMGVK